MKKIIILLILIFNTAFAQLSFDRTRVIFDAGKNNSVSILVKNTSKDRPYLAQAWIEDDMGVKLEGPLVALPILQRLNANQEKQIKVSMIGNVDHLAQDKETMFFFNVLGVPPSENTSSALLNIVISSSLKLFYRPKGLPQYKETGWVNELIVSKVGSGYKLDNPTPYHIVIYGFSSSSKSKVTEKDLILKPFSSENIPITGNTPQIYYITDQGAGKVLSYSCSNVSCDLD